MGIGFQLEKVLGVGGSRRGDRDLKAAVGIADEIVMIQRITDPGRHFSRPIPS